LYNGAASGAQTPNIDALAKDGVTFTAGYAGNSVCAPSRASIMTGRYSTRFGFEFTPFPAVGATIAKWQNDLYKPKFPVLIDELALASLPKDPMKDLGMPAEEVTMAEVLRDAGYYTAHIGKWHLGKASGMSPHEQGFVDSLNMAGSLYDVETSPKVVNAKLGGEIDMMVWASGQFAVDFNGQGKMQPARYLTDYYTDEAVNVINEHKNHPFFLYLAHWTVHNPLQASKDDYDSLPHIEDHARRVYVAMIRSLDRSVARVVQALDDNGLTNNTLVIFTADNGAAGYLGIEGLNKPFRGWKLNHFEGGYRVPYVAKWPAQIKPGTVYPDAIQHVDLLPTFTAAAGARLPTNRIIDGVDWMPFVTGQAEGVPHKTLFWKEGHHESVQHEGWKVIRSGNPGKSWLFNINPTEKENLAEKNPAKLSELHALMDAHNAKLPRPGWPSVIDMPQLIDKASTSPGHDIADGDEYIYWPN